MHAMIPRVGRTDMNLWILFRHFQPQRLLGNAVADHGTMDIRTGQKCLLAPADDQSLIDVLRFLQPLPAERQWLQRSDRNTDARGERAACRTYSPTSVMQTLLVRDRIG